MKHCLTCARYTTGYQYEAWCQVPDSLYERPDVWRWVDGTNRIDMSKASLDVYARVKGACPAWLPKEES